MTSLIIDTVNIDTECCICFEEIGEKNNCVTPCGHKFCFMCMSKSLAQNNTCPCCRTVLMEIEADEDDDSEYSDNEEDDEDDEDDQDEDDEDDDDGYAETSKEAEDTIDEIHNYLKKRGHTDKDIYGYFMGIRAKKTAKEFVGRMKKIHTDFNELQEKWVREAENEEQERQLFAAEDLSIVV